jgi:acyl-CoA synthetase (AMP-forming)/AMP-acid ligase II
VAARVEFEKADRAAIFIYDFRVNVAMLLSASAARRPERVAWIHGTACASYATPADRVARLAGGLRRSGIGAGDRLVLVMPNGPVLFEVLWACFWPGIVAVPLNRHLHPREVAFVAEHSAATGIVLSEPTRGAAGHLDQATRVIWTESPNYRELSAGAALPIFDVDSDAPKDLLPPRPTAHYRAAYVCLGGTPVHPTRVSTGATGRSERDRGCQDQLRSQ